MSATDPKITPDGPTPNRAARRAAGRRGRKLGALGSGAVLATGATAAVLGLTAVPAGAATLVVDTTDDGAATPTDCTTPVADSCSLRDAIAAAGNNDVIDASGISGTIALTDGQLYTDNNITITGPGASNLTVDAGDSSRVLYSYFSGSGTTTITGVTFTNGYATGDGGAMLLYCDDGDGSLVLDDVAMTNSYAELYGGGLAVMACEDTSISGSTFSGNHSGSGEGGGIVFYDSNDLTVTTTSVVDNHADQDDGGGIAFYGSNNLTVRNSTIANNTASEYGGGFYVNADGDVTIDQSTISGNQATGNGGGIGLLYAGGDVNIVQTTISGNTAGALGDGLYFYQGGDQSVQAAQKADEKRTRVGQHQPEGAPQEAPKVHGRAGAQNVGGSATLTGTIVSGNPGTDVDTNGAQAVTSVASLIGTTGAGINLIDGGGTVSSTAPGLGALADNGGPTQTLALLPGSPALDAGPDPVPDYPDNAFDQRGAGYPRVANGRVDIGAYESQAIALIPRFTG